MEYDLYEIELLVELQEAIKFLESQLSRVSTSGANPQLFSNLKVVYYDELTPIGDLSTINIPETQQLLIKPFDKSILKDIYKVIEKQNYGVSLVDEGHQLRVIFPILTTDKRRDMVKQLSSIKESSKIKMRNARHNILKLIKADNELSEDILNDYQMRVQKKIDEYSGIIEKKVKEKEDQLMKL